MKLKNLYICLEILLHISLICSQCQNNCLSRFPASAFNTSCTSQDELNLFQRNVENALKEQFTCGGAAWTRVAHLNMSDTQQICPSNWTLNTSPVRGCGRSFNSTNCDSVVYPVNGHSYSSVCGKIIAYHRRLSRGFTSVWMTPPITIEDKYVSGVSITHGLPGARQHIWTFVGAQTELNSQGDGRFSCSCSNTNSRWPYEVPSYIGNDYFCDSGSRNSSDVRSGAFYINDPLWDGEGCGPTTMVL